MKARIGSHLLCAGLIAAAFSVAVLAQDSKPATPPPAEPPAKPKVEYVLMGTSKGEIVLELNREKAPISVDNFLSYVDKKFYDGTIFHRVISTFMIQGGGMTPDMQEKPTNPPIKNEWENGLKNVRGSIAMARTNVPDSATCQFFINVVDNPALDQPRGGAAYAVFGKVVAGMNTVDTIKAVQTHTHPTGHQNVPVETVKIEKVTRLSAEDAQKKIAAEKKPAAPAAAPASN